MSCEASTRRMPLNDSSHSLGFSQLELLYEWPTDWEVQTIEYLFPLALDSGRDDGAGVFGSF